MASVDVTRGTNCRLPTDADKITALCLIGAPYRLWSLQIGEFRSLEDGIDRPFIYIMNEM